MAKNKKNPPNFLKGSNLDTTSGLRGLLQSHGIYTRDDYAWYESIDRYSGGKLDAYNNLGNTKEYLFFTRPDCHIFNPGTSTLQSAFATDPFFVEMQSKYPYVLYSLQKSAISTNQRVDKNPFMSILTNSVNNTLDLQALSASEMDTSTNMYGSTINYRKDAWVGDENIDFSLEFSESKWLEIYLLLKTYENYEREVTIGNIYPPKGTKSTSTDKDKKKGSTQSNFSEYIQYKELHDTFGIFKFVVDEDLESIIYYAYFCGCYFKNVPRDGLNDMNGSGLKLSVDFKAFCMDDMNPEILVHFNNLIKDAGIGDYVPVYNTNKGRINGSRVYLPRVVKVLQRNGDNGEKFYSNLGGDKYKYKLKWYDFGG